MSQSSGRPGNRSKLERSSGIVQWFNPRKGYGFIRDASEANVFVHISNLRWGVALLDAKAEVQYDIVVRGEYKSAVDVGPIRQDEQPEPSESEYLAITLSDDNLKLVSITPASYQVLGLHGELHHLVHIHSSETRAQETAVEELQELLNDIAAKERDFQSFFERHPSFILNDEYKALHPHVVLRKPTGEALIPDFVLEPVDQFRFSDLLELKLPTTKLFRFQRNRIRFSAAIAEARAQMRTYQLHFDDPANREVVEREYGLKLYKPKTFVIIGRRGKVSSIDFRQVELDEPGLIVQTYDDIVIRAQARLARMKNRRQFLSSSCDIGPTAGSA